MLGKVPGLTVKGRASSFAFKGKHVSDAEIARALGVAYIVNGSVQKSGTQVQIMARLNRAEDGTQIWSDKFNDDLKDIFAVQDRIAGLIARSLQLKLDAGPRAAQSVNPLAHGLCLEGRHYWMLRTDEGFARAEQAYAKALQLDPNFAVAHAGLANVWTVRSWYAVSAGIPRGEELARAREQAEIALRLDPTMAEAHAVLGAVAFNEWKFEDAEQAFQNALRLNPNYSFAYHWRAHLLMARGKLDESLVALGAPPS